MTYQPKILLIDIETAPSLGFVWGKWQQDVIEFKDNWFILCYAYKWLHEKSVKTVALPDFKGYKQNKADDYALAQELHKLLEEADVVVAHNGDAFDIKKINARFLVHRLYPPKPFTTVDTLKILRRVFKFDSNKLNDIGPQLGLGAKLPHQGFNTWKGCMNGDDASWKIMRKYNAQDVVLLEKVYKLLRGWSKGNQHPNINLLTGRPNCPACGGMNIEQRGTRRILARIRTRFQCIDCGKWFQDIGEPTSKIAMTPL